MRTLLLALALTGSLLAIAPTASASCSGSGSVGPDLEETWKSVQAAQGDANCLRGMAQGEVNRYQQGAVGVVKIVTDIVASWNVQGTLNDLTCGVNTVGKLPTCTR